MDSVWNFDIGIWNLRSGVFHILQEAVEIIHRTNAFYYQHEVLAYLFQACVIHPCLHVGEYVVEGS